MSSNPLSGKMDELMGSLLGDTLQRPPPHEIFLRSGPISLQHPYYVVYLIVAFITGCLISLLVKRIPIFPIKLWRQTLCCIYPGGNPKGLEYFAHGWTQGMLFQSPFPE